jgi:putative metallohydrolase (TIGR04338 family)
VTGEKTLARIASLLRQAEGTSNEHEADAFMRAAQRLATTHSIDLSVARVHTAKREAREEPVIKHIDIGPSGKRGLRTFAQLFLACGRPNDLTFDIAHNSSYVIAYGMPSDIAVAESLYASLAVQMVRASDAYVRSDAHKNDRMVIYRGDHYDDAKGEWRYVERTKPVPTPTARINFQQAFAQRLERRLTEAKNEAQSEVVDHARQERAAATGDLVDNEPTSTELAIREKAVEIRDFRKAHTTARGSWKGGRAASGHSDRARMAGDRAARQARLSGEQTIGGAPTALGWVRAEWARAAVPVRVRSRNGQARAHYERANATIAIPPYEGNRAWAMRELVVLHELAHHLEPDPASAVHGPAFVHRYARLVTEVIGPEAGLLLRSTMHSEGATPATVVTHGPTL